jgi:hypothetical protein
MKTRRGSACRSVSIWSSIGIKVNFLTMYGNQSKLANIGVQARENVVVKAVKHYGRARAAE